MSTAETPPPVPPLPRQRLGGCATAALVIFGLLLLLPGLCSLGFLAASGVSLKEPFVVTFWILAFAVAGGGIALIVYAARNS